MDRKDHGLLLAVALCAGFVGGALSGRLVSARPALAQARPQHEKAIRAESFIVVDANGNFRAGLGLLPDGTLTLNMPKDLRNPLGPGLQLGLKSDGSPHLTMMGQKGQLLSLETADGASGGLNLRLGDRPVAQFALLTNGAPSLRFWDRENKLRLGLFMIKDRGVFGLFDKDGTTRGSLEMEEDEGAGLFLHDERGQRRVALASASARGAALGFFDGGGNPRAVVAVAAEGAPGITVADKDGKARADLQMSAAGTPALTFKGQDGRILWSAP